MSAKVKPDLASATLAVIDRAVTVAAAASVPYSRELYGVGEFLLFVNAVLQVVAHAIVGFVPATALTVIAVFEAVLYPPNAATITTPTALEAA